MAERALHDFLKALSQQTPSIRTRYGVTCQEAAEAANRAKSAFLANMSHELRPPLSAIIGYNEMMEEEIDDLGETGLFKDLRKIKSNAKHLLSLINDVLDLSKIEANRMDTFAEDIERPSPQREQDHLQSRELGELKGAAARPCLLGSGRMIGHKHSEGKPMMSIAGVARRIVMVVAWSVVAAGTSVYGQTAGPAPAVEPDEEVTQPVPEAMPSDVPYGTPIRLESAKRALVAAEAEANRHHWSMNCAVVEPAGDLVLFERMDGANYGSIEGAQAKARSAARWRRSTKDYFDSVQSGNTYVLALGPTPVEGGFPIVVAGKLIGAIGCGGGFGNQAATVAKAGRDAVQSAP